MEKKTEFRTLIPGTYRLKYTCTDGLHIAAAQYRTIINVDSRKPVINVIGSANVTVEAGDGYTDKSAECYDQVDGDLSKKVVSDGSVDHNSPGEYKITYSCTDKAGNDAENVTRTVYVIDSTCPACILRGLNNQSGSNITVEASFPFVDPGVNCVDLTGQEGDLDCDNSTLKITGAVNPEKTGIYLITYQMKDYNNNWCNCGESPDDPHGVIRQVTVVDTLKPVIAVYYRDKFLMKGGVEKVRHNPAASYFMSESNAQTSSVWIIGAMISSITGVAILISSIRTPSAIPV